MYNYNPKRLLNEILSALLQVIFLTFIPFIFFLFRKDKTISFKKYIGFYKAPASSYAYVLTGALFFIAMGIVVIFISENVKSAVLSPNSVTGKLKAMGLSINSIGILLIIALFKTSLSEEIFFRGFIAKRLINKLGFRTGNIIQSLIFGLVHLVLFYFLTHAGIFSLAGIFIFSSAAGWVIGFIKEKKAAGSILPGWAAHGIGNTVSYFIIAFMI